MGWHFELRKKRHSQIETEAFHICRRLRKAGQKMAADGFRNLQTKETSSTRYDTEKRAHGLNNVLVGQRIEVPESFIGKSEINTMMIATTTIMPIVPTDGIK
jgi:hypothetical protein